MSQHVEHGSFKTDILRVHAIVFILKHTVPVYLDNFNPGLQEACPYLSVSTVRLRPLVARSDPLSSTLTTFLRSI